MFTKLLAAYIAKEDGATAIEYGLIAAGIGVAIATTVFALGGSIDTLFTDVQNCLGGVC